MKKSKIIIVLALALLLCGCTSSEEAESKQVTCNEKDEILEKEENAMLIDVRTKEEFEEKHIEKAINIPYDQIVEVLDTYGTISFDTPIIVYCKSGGRSAQAADALLEAGYKNIYDLGAMSNCD